MNRYPQLAGRRRADAAGTVPDSFAREQADISLDPLAATLEGLKKRVLSDAGPIPGCLEVDRRQMDLLKAFSGGSSPIGQLASVLGPDPQFFMGIPLCLCDTVKEEGQGPDEACCHSRESRAHARVSPEAAHAGHIEKNRTPLEA